MADVSIGINAGFPSVLPTFLDWTIYTPASTQGFGTVTAATFRYARYLGSLYISAKFAAGTVTAQEARISFPPGATSATTNALTMLGPYARNTLAQTANQVYVENNVSYLTFGRADGSTFAGQTKRNGADLISGTEEMSFTVGPIPITEWALTAVQAYGQGQATDVKSGVSAGNIGWPGGTDGSAPSVGMLGQIIEGVVTAATLTTSYVTYASIVLPKGKFEIRYEASLQPSTGSAAANETYCTAQIESSGFIASSRRSVAAKTPAASSMYSIGTAVATVEVFPTATTTTYNFQAKVTSPAGSGSGNLLNSLDYQSRFYAKRIG